MKRITILTLILLLGGFSTAAAQEVLTVYNVSSVPTIDGIAETAWDGAASTVVKVNRIPAAIVTANLEKQQG